MMPGLVTQTWNRSLETQEDYQTMGASLGYIINSRLAWTIVWDPVSNKQPSKQMIQKWDEVIPLVWLISDIKEWKF